MDNGGDKAGITMGSSAWSLAARHAQAHGRHPRIDREKNPDETGILSLNCLYSAVCRFRTLDSSPEVFHD